MCTIAATFSAFKKSQTRLGENIELFSRVQTLWEVETLRNGMSALITYISPHQGHKSLHNYVMSQVVDHHYTQQG